MSGWAEVWKGILLGGERDSGFLVIVWCVGAGGADGVSSFSLWVHVCVVRVIVVEDVACVICLRGVGLPRIAVLVFIVI